MEKIHLRIQSLSLKWLCVLFPGYMNELAYYKADGSFALVPNKQSSTW